MSKVVLLSREKSRIASSWHEYLCIERLQSNKFALSTCVYEVLGPVHDLVPEGDLYDEDGEMVIPETVDGKAVRLEDGEYLVSDQLIDDPSCEPVEFGAPDFDVALEFCREAEWTQEPHFLRVWRRINDMVRLDGQSPSIRERRRAGY